MTLIEFKKLSNEEQKNWLEENISNRTDLNYIWNKIYWISKQKFGQEDKDKNKNIKSKKKNRPLKIPLNVIRDFKDIKKDETIEHINFYTIYHSNVEYIIDMYRTSKNNFYVSITDITNGYKKVSVSEMKKKSNIQLTLDFFNI